MNKKVLGTALLAGLAIGMGSTAFAEAPGSYEKSVTFKQSDAYVLKIPATTEFANDQRSLDIQFGTSSRNVEVGKKLDLSMTWTDGDATTFNLANDANASVKIPTTIKYGTSQTVTSGAILQSFQDVNLNTEDLTTYTIEFSETNTPRAGSYTGKLTFIGKVNSVTP